MDFQVCDEQRLASCHNDILGDYIGREQCVTVPTASFYSGRDRRKGRKKGSVLVIKTKRKKNVGCQDFISGRSTWYHSYYT